jgi:hypothetical protein
MEHYAMIQGILMRKEKEKPDAYDDTPEHLRKTPRTNVRIVLPEVLIQPLVYSTHHEIAGAHAPKSRVVATIMSQFYHPFLNTLTEDILRKCRACQISKATSRPKPAMGIHHSPILPRDLVSMDLAINLPITPRKNQHILCCIDQNSGYIVAAPIRSKSSEDILTAFLAHWITPISTPLAVMADNELGIQKGVFKEYCDENGIQIHASLPYSPEGNGMAEASVKIVKNCLRALVTAENDIKNWDRYLGQVCNSINSCISKGKGESPDYIMHQNHSLQLRTNPIVLLKNRKIIPDFYKSREAQVVANLTLDAIVQELGAENIATSVPPLPDETMNIIEHTCNVRDKIRARNLEYRNSRKLPSEFHVGDVVLKRLVPKSTHAGIPFAMQRRYDGPYLVLQVYNKYVEIRHIKQGFKTIASTQYLKPYFHNDYDQRLPPGWQAEIVTAIRPPPTPTTKTAISPCEQNPHVTRTKTNTARDKPARYSD